MLNCHPMVSFGEPLEHVITLRGQILVSRTYGDFFLFSFVFHLIFYVCVVCWGREEGVCTFITLPVCRFQTSPCMPAPRAHVETHVDVLPVHAETFRMYTRWFFSVSRHTPRPHHSHSHNDTQPQANTHDNDNDNDNDNDSDNDNDNDNDKQPTKHHQPTHLRLNSVQHEKTHQVKTRQ